MALAQGTRGVGDLTERLAARREELEQTIIARVHAVEDPVAVDDPEYALGLKAAVHAAISYGLSAIDGASGKPEPVPHELLTQARRAARSGVGLDTVLRRYVAGHALLDDFIVQEAEAAGMRRGSARGALRAEAVLLDRLIDAVASEYRGEAATRSQSHRRRQVGCVEKLLAGELTDAGGLDYDLSGWHVGAVAMGGAAAATLRSLARDLDRRFLCVSGAEGVLWAWLGSVRRPDAEELEFAIASSESAQVCIVTGEPAQGLAGWRLSHRQAVAALPIALRLRQAHVRYADVALLASMLQDEVLLRSLTDLYLTPLSAERDGGASSRQTLRAYFSTRRNVSSTASALKVSRKTVTSRLRRIEQRLGRQLDSCAVELEVALDLQAMGDLTGIPSPEQRLPDPHPPRDV